MGLLRLLSRVGPQGTACRPLPPPPLRLALPDSMSQLCASLPAVMTRACGKDIVKKPSTRKGRYLLAFNFQLAPAAAGRLVWPSRRCCQCRAVAPMPLQGRCFRCSGLPTCEPAGQARQGELRCVCRRRTRPACSEVRSTPPPPPCAPRQGTLAALDTKNPVMYLDFPQGRYKLFGGWIGGCAVGVGGGHNRCLVVVVVVVMRSKLFGGCGCV